MRFQCLPLLLTAMGSVALTTVRFQRTPLLLTALGSVAFAASAEEKEHYESAHRALKFIEDVDPEVCIEYDGTPAECCTETSRHLHGEQLNDPTKCPTLDKSWHIWYKLGDGTVITINSCPMDGVLEISAEGEGKPTAADCNFMWNTATDIVKRPIYANKHSLEAQVVKGVQLLCGPKPDDTVGSGRRLAPKEHGWPASLPIEYKFNKTVEFAYQRNIQIRNGEVNLTTIHDKPSEKFIYSEYYNSLCFAADDNKYVTSQTGQVKASPTTTQGDCPGHSMMMSDNEDMSDMRCVDLPSMPRAWATGHCFGRCGGGCADDFAVPGEDPHPTQFTNDCADYDFCTRFGIHRVTMTGTPFPGNDWSNCDYEFERTIDDIMWSGDCKDGKEVEYDDPCDPTPTPVAPPTPAPVFLPPVVAPTLPPSPFNPTPKVVTFGEGKSCTQACEDASGDWECTPESMSENAFNFDKTNIWFEALTGLGVPCSNVNDAINTNPDVAKAEVEEDGTITCYSTANPRSEDSIDCDAVAPTPPPSVRFCVCYMKA